MGVTPEYEYVPETTSNAITTVDSLEEYYLLVPDHVKFVYFVYFMVHSSRRAGGPSPGSGERGGERGCEEEAPDEQGVGYRVLQLVQGGAASLRAPPRVPRRVLAVSLTHRSTMCASTRFSTRSAVTLPSASSATP